MVLRWFLLSLLLVLNASTPVLAEVAPPIHRGINMSSWLANAARQPMVEHDFAQIAAVGFDHIRLPVNPELIGFRLSDEPTAIDFKTVDTALALAAKYHLTVILDIHPSTTMMDAMEKDSAGEAHFIALWDVLARHFDEQHYPKQQLIFELLNEPYYYRDEDHYAAFAQKLVSTIRQSSPQRMIVVAAPHGSSIEGLQKLQLINDPNIIYDFHFYEPYIITHQGIHRGFPDKMLRFFRGLPYPAANVDHEADFYAPTAPDQGQAEKELRDYVQDGWGADVILKRIAIAHAWGVANKVPIICGEFGVLRNHIDAASRYQWIADVRQALDANQIPWELWDYADLMGIVELQGETSTDPVDGSVRFKDISQGTRVFEPEALAALGLKNKF